MRFLHWLAGVTLGQLATWAFWSVAGTALALCAVYVFVLWYLPIILGAILYNRTIARAFGLQVRHPF